MSVWTTSLLEVDVRHVICGIYLFIYLFFLPVMLHSEIPKLPTDLPVRVFPGVWKLLLFEDSLLGQISIPTSFCLTSFWRKWAAFLGAWCPLPAFRSCFCGICSGFKCSFNEFVGEIVVSPTYSTAIIGLPLRLEVWILPPQQALFPFCFRPRLKLELDWMFICLFAFKSLLLQSPLLPFQYCPIDVSFSE